MRITSDDAEIFYEVLGEGPALVLLHPFPASREIWRPVAEQLANRHRLILPDLRGLGESTAGNGPATMEKHAADVARVCDHAGVGRAAFAGVSVGGYVLFEFWRRFRERVAALVLCDTRATADTEEARRNRLKAADQVEQGGAEPFIEGMIPKLLGETTRANRPDLVERARRLMLRSTVQGIAAVQRGMAARPDSAPTLATINVPTLIIVGEEDTLTPVSDSEFMRSRIGGAVMRVVPRVGHLAPFEQPDPVADSVREFLAKIPLP